MLSIVLANVRMVVQMDTVIVQQESVCAILDFLVQIVMLTLVLLLDASMVIVLRNILAKICLLQINHVFVSMDGMAIDVIQERRHLQFYSQRRCALTNVIFMWIPILLVYNFSLFIHQIQKLAVLRVLQIQPVIHGFFCLLCAS
jgi:hypothetical protein